VPGSTGHCSTGIRRASFVSLLNARRLRRTVRHEAQRLTLPKLLREAHKAWHGVKLNQPDWGHSSHSLALTAELKDEGVVAHLIFNAYWEPLEFELPPVAGAGPGRWRRWIDTALDSPPDIVPWEKAPRTQAHVYRAVPRSVVVLFAALG